MSRNDKVRIRLLFVDEGSYHHEEVLVAEGVVKKYDRLIDCLREEPEVLRELYVDVDRLCSAWRVTDET